jgi:hypothetical protein
MPWQTRTRRPTALLSFAIGQGEDRELPSRITKALPLDREGAVLACGLAEGGRQGANRALANLWRRIADRLTGNHSLNAPPTLTAR